MFVYAKIVIMNIFYITILATFVTSNLTATYEEHFAHMPALIWSKGNQLSLAPSCTLSSKKITDELKALSQKKEFYHKAAKNMWSQQYKKHDPYLSMLSDPTPKLSQLSHTKEGDLIILKQPLGGCRLFQEHPSGYHDQLMIATLNSPTFIPILLQPHHSAEKKQWSNQFIARVIFNVLREELSQEEPMVPFALALLDQFQNTLHDQGCALPFTSLSTKFLYDFRAATLLDLESSLQVQEQLPLESSTFFSSMKSFLSIFTSERPMSSEEILDTYHGLIHNSETAVYNLPITDLVCMADYIHNGHHNPAIIVKAIHNASLNLLPRPQQGITALSHDFIQKAQDIFALAWINAKWDPETRQADLNAIVPALSQAVIYNTDAITHLKTLSQKAISEADQALSEANEEQQTLCAVALMQRAQSPTNLLFSKQAQFWSFALGAHTPPQTFKQDRITDSVIFITPSVAGCSFFYNSKYQEFDAILQMNQEHPPFPKVPLHLQTSTIDETTNHYAILLNILMDIARLDLEKGLNHAKRASLQLHGLNILRPQNTFQKTIELLQSLPEDYHCILNALPTTLSDVTFNEDHIYHRTLHHWAYTLITKLNSDTHTRGNAAIELQRAWKKAKMPAVKIDDVLVQADWKNYCADHTHMFPADRKMITSVTNSLNALTQTPTERRGILSKK